ncbi:hypothetical protein OnM2_064078 [Erysiphe neolycopersici]|uniref:Uncharacterized protein n=1 Tax=Erysiphe neolycopersici TaxID=212602 RepID=A0A420HN95_9PEZI|nr:hypothetical protein OnM2_064078 [Erysiphe neolycopersici]
MAGKRVRSYESCEIPFNQSHVDKKSKMSTHTITSTHSNYEEKLINSGIYHYGFLIPTVTRTPIHTSLNETDQRVLIPSSSIEPNEYQFEKLQNVNQVAETEVDL